MTFKNSQNQIIILTLYYKIQKYSFKTEFLSECLGHLQLVKN